MTPRVSLIIPAFNAAQHIDACIASVLAQSMNDYEIVVVDDGSTDATGEIVRAISDRRIRLVTQENRGQSAALNRGVSESRGNFIKFLDADDWINPPHVEAQLEALEGTTDAVASCRWGYFVDEPARPQVRPEHTNKDYDDPMEWLVDSLSLDEGMMGGWMWLIPRAVWDKSGGWDERLSLNNDFDFSIRLLLRSSGIRFATDAVYSYREGLGGALSTTRGRSALESAFATTSSGCRNLLDRENSERVRRLCADRWQRWIYAFYPSHPDLVAGAEAEVAKLGGSGLQIEGGRILQALVPLLGWKKVRRLQVLAHATPWRRIARMKARRRLKEINSGGAV